ncbi:MAG: hypothetical protein K1X88_00780 [Nannocystaceae bacterium]|nr:hypothetical protein [Nannocystaceae bacterium]
MARTAAVVVLLGLGVAAVAVIAGSRVREGEARPSSVAQIEAEAAPAPAPAPASAAVPGLPPQLRARLPQARWLAIGAGAWPDALQVQIEQDLEHVQRSLGDGGVTLLGAGAGAPVVQVLQSEPERDPVGIALADLFAPRGGRDARYRAPRITVDAPAAADDVLDALALATSEPSDDALLVYVAGHGERGESPRDNLLSLWAGSEVTAAQLAQTLDRARRPVRLVITTCFSGGFAELAFARAEPGAGATVAPRCGLFASTWDLEASGCDPNPERSEQQGYALHFLAALQRRDREGNALADAEIDYDRDGRVGLLEAHTRVRIASTAADVPTTTAERWLRAHAPTSGPEQHLDLPEEDAVIAALSPRLGLRDEATARRRLTALETELAAASREVETLRDDELAASRDAAGDLLARWPVLDDPWHPDFAAIFRGQRSDIQRALQDSRAYAVYLAARARTAAAELALAEQAAAAAPIERLVRAFETRVLARRLAARGGEAFTVYRRLLSCERDGW